MTNIGVPELIVVFLILAIMMASALGIAGFIWFLSKKANKPPVQQSPPPLPPEP